MQTHSFATEVLAFGIALFVSSFVNAQTRTSSDNYGKPNLQAKSSDNKTNVVNDTAYSAASLLRLLNNKDSQIRQSTILALSELENPSKNVIAALVNSLIDTSERVRFQALAGLTRLGKPATNELVKALSDAKPIGKFFYHSNAHNGSRNLVVNKSDLAYTALHYAKTTNIDALLGRYQAATKLSPRGRNKAFLVDPFWETGPTELRERIMSLLHEVSVQPTPALYKAIDSKDKRLAVAAIDMFRRMESDKADVVPILSRVMRRGPDALRKAAAFALASIPGAGILALKSFLTNTNVHIRRYALAAYPSSNEDAPRLVTGFLKDSDAQLRLTALKRIQYPDATNSFFYDYNLPSQRIAEGRPLSKFWSNLPESTVSAVIFLLKDPILEVRQDATNVLGLLACIYPKQALNIADTLLRQVNKPEAGVKLAAITQLAEIKIGPQSANDLNILIGELKNTNTKRKKTEIGANYNNEEVERRMKQLLVILRNSKLPDLPSKTLVETLVTIALKSRESDNRDIDSIVANRPVWKDEAVNELLARYPDLKGFDNKALMTLNRFASTSTIYNQILERLLAHPDRTMRIQAALSLSRYNTTDRVLSVLQQGAQVWDGYGGGGVDERAAAALASLGPNGVERLLSVVNDPQTSKKTRNALLYYNLSGIADRNERVAQLLLASAADSTDAEQEHMIWSLRSIKTQPAKVQTVLEQAFSSKKSGVRRDAVMVWASLGLAPDKLLDRVGKDPVADVRRTVFELLNSLPEADPRRIETTKTALNDNDQWVQREALAFASKLGRAGSDLLTAYVVQGKPLTYNFFDSVEKLTNPSQSLLTALEARKVGAAQEIRMQIDDLLRQPQYASLADRKKLYGQLQSHDESERYSAAKALLALQEDPWANNGAIATVLMNAEVYHILKKRLGRILDRLYPPGSTLTSGSTRKLPPFPWPPPSGFQRVAVPKNLLNLGQGATLGAVYNKLISTLDAADKGFEHGLFGLGEDGFALVARIEHIEKDGTPLPSPARWIKEGHPDISLLSFLGDLFFENPGYFRIIVFTVTNDLAPGSNPKAQLPNLEMGPDFMPPYLSVKPFANDQQVLALVYCFERRKNASITPWKDGALSAQQHLMKAGVWTSQLSR